MATRRVLRRPAAASAKPHRRITTKTALNSSPDRDQLFNVEGVPRHLDDRSLDSASEHVLNRRPSSNQPARQDVDASSEVDIRRRPAGSDAHVSNDVYAPQGAAVQSAFNANRRLEGASRRLHPVAKQSAFALRRRLGPAGKVIAGKIPVDGSDLQASGSESPAPRQQSRGQHREGDWRKDGRLAFSAADDEAMKRFVASHSQLKPAGQQLWKDAEDAGITHHTWASMQNHWRRKLARTATSDGDSEARRQRQPKRHIDLLAWARQEGGSKTETASKRATSYDAPKLEARPQTRTSSSSIESGRPSVRSSDRTPVDVFDGKWFCADQTHLINGNALHLDEGEDVGDNENYEFHRHDENVCRAVFTKSYTLEGRLSSSGQEIIWEDGCRWTRTQRHVQIDNEKASSTSMPELGERRQAPSPAPFPATPRRLQVATTTSKAHSDFLVFFDTPNIIRQPIRRQDSQSNRDSSRTPRRRECIEVPVVQETTMMDSAGIFYQGLLPSQISGVDAWCDKKWDEIADKVGNHFQEPRAHAHWMQFVDVFNVGVSLDEPCRSTTA